MKKIKTILLVFAFGIGILASLKVIKSNYKTLRADFLIHSKGKTQHFINSFID